MLFIRFFQIDCQPCETLRDIKILFTLISAAASMETLITVFLNVELVLQPQAGQMWPMFSNRERSSRFLFQFGFVVTFTFFLLHLLQLLLFWAFHVTVDIAAVILCETWSIETIIHPTNENVIQNWLIVWDFGRWQFQVFTVELKRWSS